MLQFHEALAIITQCSTTTSTTKLPLDQTLRRIVAEDIVIDRAMPPFDKSAMDGYACRTQDLTNPLLVVETIAAGAKPSLEIKQNQCAKIMTGAVVPQGANCVVMIEHTETREDGLVFCTKPSTKSNICRRGEDSETGDILLQKSTQIGAKHLPLFAMAGYTKVKVYETPTVGVLASGTELVEPHDKPLPFQIRNSNSSQLLAQLEAINIQASYYGIVADEKEKLRTKIAEALQRNTMLFVTGGVSVGDFDLLPEILKELGFAIHVNATAIQPGKPMLFAQRGERYCFALSGNPISSFLQFELYAKPFLLKTMGCNSEASRRIQLPLASTFQRKKDKRLQFVPAQLLENSTVAPLAFNGSAHIQVLSQADALLEIPLGTKEIKKGELAYVRFI